VNPDATQAVRPTDSIDPAALEALTDRLGRLEAGLRRELASQVERAERAEAALAAAQAQEATAAIAARTEMPAARDPQSALEATPGADRMLAFARAEAARLVAEARREADATRSRTEADGAAFGEVLVELRCHLVEREALVGEVVGIARRAVGELGRRHEHNGSTPEATAPAVSDQSDNDGGDDQG